MSLTVAGTAAAAAALCIMSALLAHAPDAGGILVEVVTSRGNVFVAGQHPDPGYAEPMIEGLGINSRMVHNDVSGNIVHGQRSVGTEESVRPYVSVPADVGFVATLDDDKSRTYSIPDLYSEYDFDGSRLVKKSGTAQNTLGYSEARTVAGDVRVSTADGNGITVSGTGRLILKLNDAGRSLLEGTAGPGTVMRMVHSPYDLAGIPHDGSRGFLVHRTASDPGTAGLDVLVGSVADSAKSGVFEYGQTTELIVYRGKCCKGLYERSGHATVTTDASLLTGAGPNGYLRVYGDTTIPASRDIGEVLRPHEKVFRVVENSVGQFDHRIYDTLPAKQHGPVLSGSFSAEFDSINGAYLVVDSAGGSSTVRASGIAGKSFLAISGLQGTVYKVTSGSDTVVAGIAGSTVRVDRFATPASSVTTSLHLYGESILYESDDLDLDMLVIDHVGGTAFEIPGSSGTVYSAHAYVKVPVTGSSVAVSDVSLDGLRLPYLDGIYPAGDSVFVPVIPGYRTLGLSVNGAAASLSIADVLGSTGLKISGPASNTVSISRNGAVHSVESTAGAVAYMVAGADGSARAHVRASVSGTSEITNTKTFLEDRPPPPPPPRPRDPMTAWIEVYVNGQLQAVDGSPSTRIFFSSSPAEDHTGGRLGQHSVYHTARFSYPETTVFDTISVPVREADFVEFYFYNHIRADGSVPPTPAGFHTHSQHGKATATAVIHHASINMSM